MSQFLKYYFNLDILGDTLPELLKAIVVVIELLFLGLTFAFILGLIISLMRISRIRILRWFAAVYIDFFRGLPLLLLLTFIYYGLALVGS